MRKVTVSPAVLSDIYNIYSNHKMHQGKTRQSKSHEAIAKQMLTPSARSTHGQGEEGTTARKAGDFLRMCQIQGEA